MWEGWIIEHCVQGQKTWKKGDDISLACVCVVTKTSSWMSVFCECLYIKNMPLDIFLGNWEIHSWPALVAPLFPGMLPSQNTIWSSVCVWFLKNSRFRENWTLFTHWGLWLTSEKICWTAVSYQICLNLLGWEVRDESQPCNSSRKFGLTYRRLLHPKPVQSPVV